ncbi:MAG: tRNA-binding protein [Chitinophagales bacterium]
MATINFSDFLNVDMRIGRILSVADFPKARKPAYQLHIDFGEAIGTKKTSAQITANYSKADLVGRLVIAVVNFPPKQIANFMSEVLVLGISDSKGDIILLEVAGENVVLGERVH